MLEQWMRKYNTSFVQPTVADAQASLNQIERVRGYLPDSMTAELRSILQTFVR